MKLKFIFSIAAFIVLSGCAAHDPEALAKLAAAPAAAKDNLIQGVWRSVEYSRGTDFGTADYVIKPDGTGKKTSVVNWRNSPDQSRPKGQSVIEYPIAWVKTKPNEWDFHFGPAVEIVGDARGRCPQNHKESFVYADGAIISPKYHEILERPNSPALKKRIETKAQEVAARNRWIDGANQALLATGNVASGVAVVASATSGSQSVSASNQQLQQAFPDGMAYDVVHNMGNYWVRTRGIPRREAEMLIARGKTVTVDSAKMRNRIERSYKPTSGMRIGNENLGPHY